MASLNITNTSHLIRLIMAVNPSCQHLATNLIQRQSFVNICIINNSCRNTYKCANLECFTWNFKNSLYWMTNISYQKELFCYVAYFIILIIFGRNAAKQLRSSSIVNTRKSKIPSVNKFCKWKVNYHEIFLVILHGDFVSQVNKFAKQKLSIEIINQIPH